jgi:hypothetical protein
MFLRPVATERPRDVESFGDERKRKDAHGA